MNGTKSAFSSLTIQGALISVLAKLLVIIMAWLGYETNEGDLEPVMKSAEVLIPVVISFVADGITTWGRIRANTRITRA